MKTAKLSASLLAAALTVGILNPAAAMPHQNTLPLTNGFSSTQVAGGTDYYTFELASSSRVVISSRSFDPIGGMHIRLRGKLLDENDRVVSSGNGRAGSFTLNEQLPPGSYTLVMDSWNNSAKREGVNQYYLHADVATQR